MSASLFAKTRDYNGDVYRNIVSLRESVDLFDDLTDEGLEDTSVAVQAEMRVKENAPSGIIGRGFHYTTAIEYPFTNEPYLRSRYGNGSFGVWYGALEMNTTIFETAFHMMKEEARVEGGTGRIIRERAVYWVHARAVLIDLMGKEKQYPDLVGEDYGFTQQIAERLKREGHPGLLAPSARCSGTNLVAFNAGILGEPRPCCYLTYNYDSHTRELIVERQPGDIILTHQFR